MTADLGAIAAARLEGAQMEWERGDRERRIILGHIAIICDQLFAAIQHQHRAADAFEQAVLGLTGLRQHLDAGDWMKSPQRMAAERAAEESTSDAHAA